jgi:kynurenine formamidase
MAYGKQRGNGLNKFSERQIYRQWFGEQSNPAQQHPFANNANSAFRRDVWKNQPFDETLTGLEDLDWAHKVMRNGYRIAYVAEAPVIHVHEETWKQTYTRYRREAIAMRHILPQERFTLLDLLRLSFAGIVGDVRVAWNEGSLRRELSSILMFRLSQYIGTYHGYRQRDTISQNLRETFYYPGENRGGDSARQAGESTAAPISYVDAEVAGTRRSPLEGGRLYDISVALDRAPVWPGEPSPQLTEVKSLSAGDGVTVSELSMCVHTGTHIDAPAHFIDDGEAVSELGLERLLGAVRVVDLGDARQIDAARLQKAGIAPGCRRVLFRTSNSRRLQHTEFDRNYVAVTPDGAEWLTQNAISLIGIDYASIEAFDEPDNQTHKILLGAGVVVLEGLDLSQVSAGSYELLCLPLKIGAAEAAPARVVLIDRGDAA